MPFFQRDDTTTLYYEIHGEGQPLLLIHGFMGTGTSEFAGLLPELTKTYQVIAPDLRGYGKSTPKPRPYGRDFYRTDAEDLAALLADLGLSGVRVVGYSDGGEVALWLPLLAPERVQCVLCWGATGFFDAGIKPAVLGYLGMNWRTPTLDALHGAEHVTTMGHNWVHAMLAIIDTGGDITFSRAGEIRCPVLMMLGDGDALNPVAQGQAMAAAIPQGQFIAFKNTGHHIHTERPQEFYETVKVFLSKSC